MGVWNTHTNVGNILGYVIPGIFVDTDWALSFMVPGFIILSMGITVFFWITPCEYYKTFE
jgi:OPA family glycerol-3-phosphate transporter-like MFS transporter 1/2